MDYYVTEEHLKALKAELEELRTTKRIEVAKRLKRAKELGDLSENSEYIEAREEQAEVERRIFELEQMAKNATIITEPEKDKEKVQIGSTIEVEKGEQCFRFRIVGSSEARPEAGFISNESPLGKAFLERKVGDTIVIKVPAGTVTYKIVKIGE